MDKMDLIKELSQKNEKKIIFFVIDGLGGITYPEKGKTELEAAITPNLDKLAQESLCGLSVPISYGITPGSGPSHLSLFGYDPLKHDIGRGVLEALGLGLTMTKNDLAARANFATLDYEKNIVVDRRAGRPATEKTVELCKFLQEKIPNIGDVEIIIKPGKGHRFVVLFRGEGLGEKIYDNDPQKDGHEPHTIREHSPDNESKKTSHIVNQFIDKAMSLIKDNGAMNYVLVRGFSKYPAIPSMKEAYKLTPAAIAVYPMYKGLAQLVGMDILKVPGETLSDEIALLKKEYNNYDFFYVHSKETDAFGEDGNFEGKVNKLNEIDKIIPELLSLDPDVLVITGDHSTPAVIKGHSWHPVPLLLRSKYKVLNTGVKRFTEQECLKGYLGIFSAQDVMPLAMANTFKLAKYGA